MKLDVRKFPSGTLWAVPFTDAKGKKYLISVEACSAKEAAEVLLRDLDGEVDDEPYILSTPRRR